MVLPSLQLKHNKKSLLALQSPWIFSGAILRVPPGLQDGQWVNLEDDQRKIIASGHYFNSSIILRVMSFTEVENLQDFYSSRVRRAYDLRVIIGFVSEGGNTSFRLIHGEGDGLSGLIVDVYGSVAVIQCHTLGMWKDLKFIVQALLDLSAGFRSIYSKSEDILQYADVKDGYLWGDSPDEVEILEEGLRYRVDFVKGQKTGLFLDQRDNRSLLVHYCRDKLVLNTFCYTGGFSLAALKGGAAEVISVDQSAWAVANTEANVKLNFGQDAPHQVVQSKVLPYLQEQLHMFDVIVVDPPAYAKSMEKRHNAIQAYGRLNYEAIKHLSPGGLLFTFSCSQVVTRELFEGAVLSAAMQAKRPARIIHYLQQSPDHPVNIFHREGLYLKGLAIAFD